MILLDGNKVQMKGDPGVLFFEMLNLNITIMQNTGLMELCFMFWSFILQVCGISAP